MYSLPISSGGSVKIRDGERGIGQVMYVEVSALKCLSVQFS